MTKEEVKDLLKFIIRRCDLVINNENYTADEYSQDKVEDIAEMCHRVLDGQFGEIIETSKPSLPSNLDEAANNYGVDIRLGYPRVMDETDRYIYNAFKAGAEWMAGQGQTFEAHVDNGCAIASGVKLPFVLWGTYEDGDVLKVQIRKK